MPKIDIAALPVVSLTDYPGAFRHVVAGRSWQRLGEAVGLTQFGVNLVRIKPGSASSLRHWHEHEDEFVYVIEGELVLVEDDGETIMRPGDAAAFKAGAANGHHLVNRSAQDAVFLVVGARVTRDRCHYSDVDLIFEDDGKNQRYTRKSGEPYSDAPSA
jgi:uncharacterized cupin superfamily protein